MAWAAAGLIFQAVRLWGAARPDYSRPAGSSLRGVLYSFTVAMAPTHKESIRLHPLEFAVGLVMHLGALSAIGGIVLLLLRPAAAWAALALLRPVCIVALLAGVALLVRRAWSPLLRGVSNPDDYLALLATCGLLALAVRVSREGDQQTALLAYAVPFFLYFPLGKLRHAVLFFVARGDLGRRLGYRGVWPPGAVGSEQAHG